MSASFPRITVARSYDAFADALRERIVSGALAPGTTLPGERDLVVQTGLGRGSVREAIRKLEAEGLLVTKPGRYGGTVVQHGNADAIGRLVDVFIQGRRIPFTTLLQTRQAIEPTLAALAAANRTDEAMAAIDGLGAELEAALPDRRGEMSRLNVEWHLAVADASGNDLLAAFMHSIAPACLRAGALEDYGSDQICRGLLLAHASITTAIRNCDVDAARRRMARHLDAYRSELAELAPRQVDVGPMTGGHGV